MFNTNLLTKYATDYHLCLVDMFGTVKSDVHTSNVFIDNWWNVPNPYSPGNIFVSEISCGDGSGTPSMSDTGLFHALWSIGASSETKTIDRENKSIEFVSNFSFPANSSYVGTITEVGCASPATAGLFTHALLKDAEGNPMSIEKTDTDVLKITVTITISYSTASPWQLIDLPGYLWRFRAWQQGVSQGSQGSAASQWENFYFCLGTTSADTLRCSTRSSGNQSHLTPSIDSSCHGVILGTLNKDTKKVSFPNTRITADVGASRPIYFNYLVFNGFCSAALPDPSLFTYYTIDDIEIGIGDGQRTSFANPLDYFVKDSEKIYKNSTLLVRNVDYTIDYRNNSNRLPELAATKNCIVSGVTVAKGNTGYYTPFRRCVLYRNNAAYEEQPAGWNSTTPLVIELEQDEDINTFYVPAWVATGTITLQSSADKETWTNVVTINHTVNTPNIENFATIVTKYLRITGTNTTWINHLYNEDNKDTELFIGYVGDPYITFTDAPAEGDVITMEVQMDRPFKNGNFVIDLSAELQLG